MGGVGVQQQTRGAQLEQQAGDVWLLSSALIFGSCSLDGMEGRHKGGARRGRRRRRKEGRKERGWVRFAQMGPRFRISTWMFV